MQHSRWYTMQLSQPFIALGSCTSTKQSPSAETTRKVTRLSTNHRVRNASTVAQRTTAMSYRRKRGASGSLPELDPIPGTSRFKHFQNQQQLHAYPSSVPAWARPVSSSSASSSKKGTPSSSRPRSPANEAASDGNDEDGEILALSAGCQPDSVYQEALSWSRYTARSYLVRSLEWESPILAKLQVGSCREAGQWLF